MDDDEREFSEEDSVFDVLDYFGVPDGMTVLFSGSVSWSQSDRRPVFQSFGEIPDDDVARLLDQITELPEP